MMDANQVWNVKDAISSMKKLACFKPKFIEEPTHPDDILGHATIAEALNSVGIGVATGETCPNQVMFKQYLQARGLQYCQIDSCRMAGLNEVLAVLLLAAKFQGIGLEKILLFFVRVMSFFFSIVNLSMFLFSPRMATCWWAGLVRNGSTYFYI